MKTFNEVLVRNVVKTFNEVLVRNVVMTFNGEVVLHTSAVRTGEVAVLSMSSYSPRRDFRQTANLIPYMKIPSDRRATYGRCVGE